MNETLIFELKMHGIAYFRIYNGHKEKPVFIIGLEEFDYELYDLIENILERHKVQFRFVEEVLYDWGLIQWSFEVCEQF